MVKCLQTEEMVRWRGECYGSLLLPPYASHVAITDKGGTLLDTILVWYAGIAEHAACKLKVNVGDLEIGVGPQY